MPHPKPPPVAGQSRTRTSRLALAFGIALCGGASSAATLTVAVDNVKTSAGQVRIAVYTEANWLNKEDWTRRALVPAEGTGVTATFDLPPGTYAVAVLHDVNDNGKMDYRLLRLPKEPYGFSNGAKPKLAPPTFEDAAFRLADEGLAIAITLTD